MMDNISLSRMSEKNIAFDKLFMWQQRLLAIEPRKASLFRMEEPEEEREIDFYTRMGLDTSIDDDCINTDEVYFMKGYLEA
ncbi:MAG: hypothetical protein WC755_04420 [Candidatus Woesearchaeota archaeon]|jgi:hypothetical protein